MPAQYDIKAIGDQVHKLTLELEIEKVLTNILFQLLQGTSGVGLNTIAGMAKADLNPSDSDAAAFDALRKERFADLLAHLTAKSGD